MRFDLQAQPPTQGQIDKAGKHHMIRKVMGYLLIASALFLLKYLNAGAVPETATLWPSLILVGIGISLLVQLNHGEDYLQADGNHLIRLGKAHQNADEVVTRYIALVNQQGRDLCIGETDALTLHLNALKFQHQVTKAKGSLQSIQRDSPAS